MIFFPSNLIIERLIFSQASYLKTNQNHITCDLNDIELKYCKWNIFNGVIINKVVPFFISRTILPFPVCPHFYQKLLFPIKWGKPKKVHLYEGESGQVLQLYGRYICQVGVISAILLFNISQDFLLSVWKW